MSKQCMLRVDPDRFKVALKKHGFTQEALSTDMGRSKSYVCAGLYRGAFPKPFLSAIDTRYGITYDDIKPRTGTNIESTPTTDDIRVELELTDGIVKFCVFDGDKCLTHAFAHRKNSTDLALMQAISYAAHLCYKFYQQREFRDAAARERGGTHNLRIQKHGGIKKCQHPKFTQPSGRLPQIVG